MFDTTPEGIERLVVEGESQTVEFKSRWSNNHYIAQVLTAFANTKGGILLIGVDDKGEIVGISDDAVGNALDRLQKVVSSLLPFPIETGVVDVHGKNVVYAIVPEAPQYLLPVMTSRGESYQRELSRDVRVRNHAWLQTGITYIDNLPDKKEVIVFIAMSFREEEDPALVDYFQAMERAVKATSLPIKLTRVDLVEGDYEISQQIMDEINKADVVLADFTLSSRNVYFELGYARGVKKRIIQIARKGTELEFDVRNWRTLLYRNATELEKKLLPELKAAYAQVIGDTAS
ncbi:MAG: ATP-binding protein [Acidobacteria bacterium]|nr:ATP-binding protein [Acidobacteriota bacterium]